MGIALAILVGVVLLALGGSTSGPTLNVVRQEYRGWFLEVSRFEKGGWTWRAANKKTGSDIIVLSDDDPSVTWPTPPGALVEARRKVDLFIDGIGG